MALHIRISCTLAVLLLWCAASGQSGKAFFKEGEKFRAEQQLDKAVEKYGFAVSIDPKFIKAYQARAECYGLLGREAERAADLGHVADLDPAESEFACDAAEAFMSIDSAGRAMAFCERAVRVAPKSQRALILQARTCLRLNNLDCAARAADAALAQKATTDSYYIHGLVRTATKDYKTAEFDLEKVLEWNHLYEAAYVALSEVQLFLFEQYSGPTMQLRTLEKAVEKCTRALELNPRSTDALFTRSKAYAQQKEYAKAIDDISRCLALERKDRAVYFQRALYYQGYGQFQNAVNDLNQIILNDPKDVEALLRRSSCRESNLNLEGALKDLELAQRAMELAGTLTTERRNDLTAQRERIAHQLFELNRESDPPAITVIEPFHLGDQAQVSASLGFVKVSGHVRDKSLLKTVTVNGAAADFSADEKDPQFVISIPFETSAKEIVVQAIDVYDNIASEVLAVERTEGIPPSIALTTPSLSGDREITIPVGKEDVFIEGRVTDASLIRLIAVDGVNASYPPDQIDPEFSIKVDLKDKHRFIVRAEDQFGNATESVINVVRKAEQVAVKPVPSETASTATAPRSTGTTGVTWIVHIENTNYRNFPALRAGGNDAGKMQKAFAAYSVQRTISKKNLTKDQFERFFNIELRDLARTNKVNTILVWYSGHGRTAGGKAYWVPVDGSKDDIYSYFNYGSLKAQMQNYSESVGNTVVVSDAAGGDDSFYELTR